MQTLIAERNKWNDSSTGSHHEKWCFIIHVEVWVFNKNSWSVQIRHLKHVHAILTDESQSFLLLRSWKSGQTDCNFYLFRGHDLTRGYRVVTGHDCVTLLYQNFKWNLHARVHLNQVKESNVLGDNIFFESFSCTAHSCQLVFLSLIFTRLSVFFDCFLGEGTC